MKIVVLFKPSVSKNQFNYLILAEEKQIEKRDGRDLARISLPRAVNMRAGGITVLGWTVIETSMSLIIKYILQTWKIMFHFC